MGEGLRARQRMGAAWGHWGRPTRTHARACAVRHASSARMGTRHARRAHLGRLAVRPKRVFGRRPAHARLHRRLRSREVRHNNRQAPRRAMDHDRPMRQPQLLQQRRDALPASSQAGGGGQQSVRVPAGANAGCLCAGRQHAGYWASSLAGAMLRASPQLRHAGHHVVRRQLLTADLQHKGARLRTRGWRRRQRARRGRRGDKAQRVALLFAPLEPQA